MKELEEIARIATGACDLVRRCYAGTFRVDYKVGDDPVTTADREANDFICQELGRAFPGVPVVAEESDPRTFDARRGAPECFFVDPLDGTREFVARNGEFAVMIGLARGGKAALGVVAAPVSGRVWCGERGGGSFDIAPDGSRTPIHTSAVVLPGAARVLVSRSRATDETFALLGRLGVTRADKLGSAGLKASAVACGEADAWLQPSAGGKLWDVCGPEAVAVGAGACFGTADGAPIDYSRGPLELSGVLVAATRDLFERLALR